MASGQTVGAAVGGLDEQRRIRNVTVINSQLDTMQRSGAILSTHHRQEPARSGQGTVDLWEIEFPGEEHGWTYSYVAVRALVKGYRLGCDHPRSSR